MDFNVLPIDPTRKSEHPKSPTYFKNTSQEVLKEVLLPLKLDSAFPEKFLYDEISRHLNRMEIEDVSLLCDCQQELSSIKPLVKEHAAFNLACQVDHNIAQIKPFLLLIMERRVREDNLKLVGGYRSLLIGLMECFLATKKIIEMYKDVAKSNQNSSWNDWMKHKATGWAGSLHSFKHSIFPQPAADGNQIGQTQSNPSLQKVPNTQLMLTKDQKDRFYTLFTPTAELICEIKSKLMLIYELWDVYEVTDHGMKEKQFDQIDKLTHSPISQFVGLEPEEYFHASKSISTSITISDLESDGEFYHSNQESEGKKKNYICKFRGFKTLADVYCNHPDQNPAAIRGKYHFGYEYTRSLLEYSKKLKVIFSSIGKVHNWKELTLFNRFSFAAFYSSAPAYFLLPNRASLFYEIVRSKLTLDVQREVWNLLEDPVIEFFATSLGLNPKPLSIPTDSDLTFTVVYHPQPTIHYLYTSKTLNFLLHPNFVDALPVVFAIIPEEFLNTSQYHELHSIHSNNINTLNPKAAQIIKSAAASASSSSSSQRGEEGKINDMQVDHDVLPTIQIRCRYLSSASKIISPSLHPIARNHTELLTSTKALIKGMLPAAADYSHSPNDDHSIPLHDPPSSNPTRSLPAVPGDSTSFGDHNNNNEAEENSSGLTNFLTSMKANSIRTYNSVGDLWKKTANQINFGRIGGGGDGRATNDPLHASGGGSKKSMEEELEIELKTFHVYSDAEHFVPPLCPLSDLIPEIDMEKFDDAVYDDTHIDLQQLDEEFNQLISERNQHLSFEDDNNNNSSNNNDNNNNDTKLRSNNNNIIDGHNLIHHGEDGQKNSNNNNEHQKTKKIEERYSDDNDYIMGEEEKEGGEDVVVLHIHGGGWISQSPKTHLSYLYSWAVQSDIPIISLDYTLSPEGPFPTALEEAYGLYRWLLLKKNAKSLGFSSSPRIILAGDSAGANLCCSLLIRIIQEKIRRPIGALLHYPVVFLAKSASIGRLIFNQDPILNYQSLKIVLESYLGDQEKYSLVNPYISPGTLCDAVLSHFPNTVIMVGDVDPLVDDSTYLFERLRNVGVKCFLEIFRHLPHGYLNLPSQLPTAPLAIRDAANYLKWFVEEDNKIHFPYKPI